MRVIVATMLVGALYALQANAHEAHMAGFQVGGNFSGGSEKSRWASACKSAKSLAVKESSEGLPRDHAISTSEQCTCYTLHMSDGEYWSRCQVAFKVVKVQRPPLRHPNCGAGTRHICP